MRAVPFFAGLTETKKSSISNRSTKLFTLSAIYSAMQTLFAGLDAGDLKEKIRFGTAFWIEVGVHIPDWQLAKEHKITAADLRRDYIHSHALALAAIATRESAIRQVPPQLEGNTGRAFYAGLVRTDTHYGKARASECGPLVET